MNLWDVMVSIFWFMLLVAWFWLLIAIVSDIFRDESLSGVAKGFWCIFVILLPWLGVLTYLIARGHSMGERSARQAAQNEEHFRTYVRDVAGSGTGVADELERLTKLHQQGVISDDELALAKQRVLQGEAPGGSPTPAGARAV
jgi:phospholipase D-like protein